MKKLIKITLLLLLVIFMFSCTQQNEVQETTNIEVTELVPDSAAPFFMVNELPDIGEFGGKSNGRFYEEYTPDFIPSDEYGMVIPYMTNYKKYINRDDERIASSFGEYGFCTLDGTIVTDASSKISDVSPRTTSDGFAYYLVSLLNTDAEEYSMFYSDKWLLPISGEWCIDLTDGYYFVGASEGIIITECNQASETGKPAVVLYDYNGKKICSFDGVDCSSWFSCGLMSAYVLEHEEPNSYFLDKSGNKALGPYYSCGEFNEYGITYAEIDDDVYYLIDTSGNVISDTAYRFVRTWYKDIIIAAQLETYKWDILSTDGQLMLTIDDNVSFVDVNNAPNGEILLKYSRKNNKESRNWFRLSDGTSLSSLDFLVSPNMYTGVSGLFLNVNDEKDTAVFFDSEGKTIAVIDDFSLFDTATDDYRYIIYVTAEEQKHAVYDTVKNEVVFTLDGSGSRRYFAGGGYFVYTKFKGEAVMYGDTVCSLYDLEKRECVFKDCLHIKYTEVGGNEYYTVVTENASTLYDEDLNIILRCYSE